MSAGVRFEQIAAVLRHLRYERIGFRDLPMADVSSDQADVAEAIRWLGVLTVSGRAEPALYSHPTSSVSFVTRVQPGDRVVADCALLPDVWDRNTGGVQFTVSVEGASGLHASSTLVVSPGTRPADRQWRRLTVALPIQDA